MSRKIHRRWSRRLKNDFDEYFRPKVASSSEPCLITLNFEKSGYFQGCNLPRSFIFNEVNPYKNTRSVMGDKMPSSLVSKESLEKREDKSNSTIPDELSSEKVLTTLYHSEIHTTSSPTIRISKKLSNSRMEVASCIFANEYHMQNYRKLHAFEYVEADDVRKLTKLNNDSIRCYILHEDKKGAHELVMMLEDIKNDLRDEDWCGCRIIVMEQGFNMAQDVLRQEKFVRIKQHNSEDYEPSNYDADDLETEIVKSRKYKDSMFVKQIYDPNITEDTATNAMQKLATSVKGNIGVALHTAKEIRRDLENVIYMIEDDDII